MIIENEILPDDEPEGGNGGKEITWNVTKVNAPAVWSLGYTGTGIKVGVLDTGVNYNHVDLADHMWTDPSYPNHGYDFANSDNNPMDDHGHGTHCAGTVAGDGTAGSQTGMAPNATIIALKVLDAGGSGQESGVWAAIQFIVDHGGDVISMSLGWQQAWNPDRLSWRNSFNNALAAGVISSVAAGNEGTSPGVPNNLRTPGDVPPPWLHPDQTLTGGVSGVVSVGATDINDAIASFSSRGPVTWSTINPFNDYAYNPGMGLIRPDISAPGDNIKSLDYSSNTGYADGWSGTSMATPCVAGVMALMLNKNPNLTPAEIDYAIEMNALELGTAGKDNTFGAGRINALAAINALGLSANFSANITNVCTGSSVIFTNLSGGDPTSWSWSFPGGTPGSYSGANPPAITYNTPGIYNVSLTVSDGIDTDTETKTGYITVQNVFANFSGTPTSVVIGNTVTFTDNSTCSPTAWSWSFPGGTPATATGVGPHIVTYNTLGTYDVSLTVTKSGNNDTETKTGYISVIPPEFNMNNETVTTCTGNFYDSGGSTGQYANNEDFTKTFYPSTPGSMIRFTFNSFTTEANYDYLRIYNGTTTAAPLIGTYHGTTGPGTVTASNASGALTFNFTSDVSVLADGWSASISCYSTTVPPVANFSASSTTPPISSTVNFTDLSDGFPTAWSWSFNPSTITYTNGTSSISQNPQVIFNELGLYDVTLTATNAYGSDGETKFDYINVINCTYCPAGSGNGSEEWIANVTFNTINNSSSAGTGYTDYSGICTTVTPGVTYPVSVSCGSIGSWTEHIWVFIDWNQNCDFLDAGESTDLGQITGPGVLTGNITVPLGAVSGSTRLRAMLKFSSDPTPCELNYSYGETEDYCITVPSQTLYIDVTAFLEGPFVGTSMNQGLIGHIPLNQPYNVGPWNYTGTESVVSIPANAIDWVLIELRDATTAGGAGSATRIARKAAFIKNDGRIVNLNGDPVLDFGALTITNNLYAVVHHRNHLSVLSATGLTQTGGVYNYNFSTGSGQAYGGTNAHKQIGAGVWGMFGGDGDKSGSINNGDESPLWEVTAGTKGYLGTDYNLDSHADNKDKDDVWEPNIGAGDQVPD
jgi:PKD repeat protein